MSTPRDRGPEPDERLHRENVPGSLDHASGDIDEVEAILVAGAGGAPNDDEDAIAADAAAAEEQYGPVPAAGKLRFGQFVRASWAELGRVVWPDRQQVGQAVLVVLGFLVIAGAFLGAADVTANFLVDLIV